LKTEIDQNTQRDELNMKSFNETIRKFDKYMGIVEQKINDNSSNDIDTSASFESQISTIKKILKQNEACISECSDKFEKVNEILDEKSQEYESFCKSNSKQIDKIEKKIILLQSASMGMSSMMPMTPSMPTESTKKASSNSKSYPVNQKALTAINNRVFKLEQTMVDSINQLEQKISMTRESANVISSTDDIKLVQLKANTDAKFDTFGEQLRLIDAKLFKLSIRQEKKDKVELEKREKTNRSMNESFFEFKDMIQKKGIKKTNDNANGSVTMTKRNFQKKRMSLPENDDTHRSIVEVDAKTSKYLNNEKSIFSDYQLKHLDFKQIQNQKSKHEVKKDNFTVKAIKTNSLNTVAEICMPIANDFSTALPTAVQNVRINKYEPESVRVSKLRPRSKQISSVNLSSGSATNLKKQRAPTTQKSRRSSQVVYEAIKGIDLHRKSANPPGSVRNKF